MAVSILMPALSPTMKEGTLSRWCVREGEQITSGQLLAEIETDKAVMEFEAADEGIVGKLLVPEGAEKIPVNTPIAILIEQGENIAAPTPPPKTEPAKKVETTLEKHPPLEAQPKAQSVGNGQDSPLFWSGESVQKTVREALRDAMAEEMRRDPDVFLMGEEVAEYGGAYKVSQGLLEEFGPRRVIDTPITEQGFAGLGAGAAMAGLRPIVEFMTFNFSLQAMDQILNTAAKTRYMSGGQIACPLVFRGPNGAAARVAAQHSQCFASWFAHCPGLKVFAPWAADDAAGLLKTAIRDPNPVIFLENEILYGQEFDTPKDSESWLVQEGKSRIWREGTDITIIAFSIMVGKSLEAAQILSKEFGINAEIIDLRSLRPLDTEAIVKSVQKTNRLVAVEEGWHFSGIGAEISAIVMEKAFDWLDAPVQRVTAKNVPLPYAANLEQHALPQVQDIIDAARALCS